MLTKIAVIITVAAAIAFTAGMIAGGAAETAQQPDADPSRLSAEIAESEPGETTAEPVELSMPEESPEADEPETARDEPADDPDPETEPAPEPEPTEETEPGPAAEDEPETEVEPDHEPEIEPIPWTDADVEMLAKLMYAEAGGIHDKKQQAAIAWCVLNRLDAGGFGTTIAEVITAPEQFAWHEGTVTTDEMRELAEDVLTRWWAEKQGAEDVGRTLPSCYLYFDGDGVTNHFHVDWQGQYSWGWTLPDPYSEEG